MKCPTCGNDLADDAYFCPECGALVSNNQKKAYDLCPHCACKVEPGAKYCPSCGGAIRQELYMQCPYCHGKVAHGALRCPSCGKSLKKRGNLSLVIIIIALSLMIAGAAGAAVYLVSIDDIDDPIASTAAPSNGTLSSVSASGSTPGAIASLAPSPFPSPMPTSIPTPILTPTPMKKHRYEVVVSHVSWVDAKAAAENKGGHLVTFSDMSEFNEVIGIISASGHSSLKNVWIGACAPSGLDTPSLASAYWNSSNAYWITGEQFDFAKWRHGEPSGYDANMGVEEQYLQIFRPKADGGEWSFNDASYDLSEYKEGTLGYIIEYE